MLLAPADAAHDVVHDVRDVHRACARATMLPEDPVTFRRRAAARIWSSRALYVAAIVAIAGLVSWGAAERARPPSSPAAALVP